MKNGLSRQTPVLFIGGLTALYILSVLCNLGVLDFRVEEARRSIVSLGMLESGNFIQPQTLGWDYFNKPPVFNWLLAAFISITGSDSQFVLRLPSFFSLLAIGACHYFIAKKFLPKQIALLSAFFTFTSADLYFYVLSNGTEIDVFYSLVVYLQVISMFWFYEHKRYYFLFGCSWALCAIGFLTKGYPSLVFQLLTMLALCVHARNWKLLFHWKQFAGIILFVVMTGTYYFIYSKYHHPSLPLINLLNESLLKSAVGNESTGRLYRIFTYPLLLLRVLLPWCLLLLLLIRKPKISLWNNRLVRFSVLFFLFNITVYWVTGAQKTRYIVMFIPFVMTVAAYIYDQWEKINPSFVERCLKIAGGFFGIVTIALLVIPFFAAVELWKVFSFAAVMILFMYFYFKLRQNRIWLFLLGFILTRFIYAAIGIPEKSQRQFSYRGLVDRIVAENNQQPVDFWGKPDTLQMNVVIGDTILKWRRDPVVVLPYYVRYEMPFYIYKASGTMPVFDTIMMENKTYITLSALLAGREVERMDSIYDAQFKDHLVIFRKKPKAPAQATPGKINIHP